jgi:triacylglycerol lipase
MSAQTSPAPPSPPRNPVLLIHGLKDDARKMDRLARHLRTGGWEAHTLSLVPSWGQLGLDALAQQIADFVAQTFPDGRVFDLVGFSMGGLVCRYYLQRLGGLARVRRFVTISAPHRGSLLAWLIPNAGCRQMRPGSAFLRDLQRDVERLGEIQFTSLWTQFDLIIVPAVSSILPVGESRRFWCVAHPLMVWESRCLRAVAQALSKS